jgi:hypothetical protein
MNEPLFTVENIWTIRGRGRCIEGFKFEQYPLFKIGDGLLIARPDGSHIQAIIKEIERPDTRVYVGAPPPFSQRRFALVLDIDDIPLGSVVLRIEPARWR